MTQSLYQTCAISGETSAAALVIQTLWPAISLQIAILLLHVREGVCALHPSPHKAAQTLSKHQSFNTLLSLGDNSWLASITL